MNKHRIEMAGRPAFTSRCAWLRRWGLRCILGIAGVLSCAIPTQAAEEIILSFGSLQRSISVAALEDYAETGEASSHLRPYLRYFNTDQQAQLRSLLTARAEISHVAIAQFLYTRQGEILLEQMGELIQTDAYQSGFYALRSSMILAASSEDGLTLVNVLKHFPTERLRLDLRQTFVLLDELEELISQTTRAAAAIQRQAEFEKHMQPELDWTEFPDWRSPGAAGWQRETFVLSDEQRAGGAFAKRNRTFPVDLYWPVVALDSPMPVIVISHGLGSDRTSYAYVAQHLASHGFAVVVPEHPGSNSQQMQALIEGRVNEVTNPREFIDRPLDIQLVLDELETLSALNPRFQHKLDLTQVGIIGHSMGGYTALALAGATVDVQQLMADCLPTSTAFNLSLLLQCRILEIPDPQTSLQDERVKAVIAINPIGSSILGQSGFANVQTPVMIITSTADTIAPALLEQIQPFTWLETSDHYLLSLQGATHFSTIGTVENEIVLPEALVGPDPAIAQRYVKAISTPFFKTYLTHSSRYSPALQAAYANHISHPALPLHLITRLDPEQLMRAIANEVDPISQNEEVDS
jgi:predicted dienelactone hydrolase